MSDGLRSRVRTRRIDGRLVPVGKLEVHQRGLRHKAVSVFVLDGTRVLIQKRAAGKYHTPGLWANTCCTHPLWEEDAASCAVRRLREELGITGLVPAFAGQVEYRADVGGGLVEHGDGPQVLMLHGAGASGHSFASQAIAQGLGGFAGAALVDALRLAGDTADAFGLVFALEAGLFLAAGLMAWRIIDGRRLRSHDSTPDPTFIPGE